MHWQPVIDNDDDHVLGGTDSVEKASRAERTEACWQCGKSSLAGS